VGCSMAAHSPAALFSVLPGQQQVKLPKEHSHNLLLPHLYSAFGKKRRKNPKKGKPLEETKTKAIWSHPASVDGASIFSHCFTQWQDLTQRGVPSPLCESLRLQWASRGGTQSGAWPVAEHPPARVHGRSGERRFGVLAGCKRCLGVGFGPWHETALGARGGLFASAPLSPLAALPAGPISAHMDPGWAANPALTSAASTPAHLQDFF